MDLARWQRAELHFRSHYLELDRYFSQGLNQSRYLLFIGIGVIGGGLLVVYFTIQGLLAKSSPSPIDNTSALLAGLTTLLTNFVGATLLKMYSDSLTLATQLHQDLAKTHQLHFKNYLASTITNDDVRDKVLHELVSPSDSASGPA